MTDLGFQGEFGSLDNMDVLYRGNRMKQNTFEEKQILCEADLQNRAVLGNDAGKKPDVLRRRKAELRDLSKGIRLQAVIARSS